MIVGLTFPTGHMPSPGRVVQPPMLGEPHRANACRCDDRQVIDPLTDQCVTCGHYPKQIITKTWHERAQILAQRRRA